MKRTLIKNTTLILSIIIVTFVMTLVCVDESQAATDDPDIPVNLKTLNCRITDGKTQATVGDIVTWSIKANENVDINYIGEITIKLLSPTGKKSTLYLEFNSATGLYEDTIAITDRTEYGKWRSVYFKVEFGDGASWSQEVTGAGACLNFANRVLAFTVVGTHPDITAPVIDLSSLKITNISAGKESFDTEDTIVFSVNASDDEEIEYIKIKIIGPYGGNGSYYNMTYNNELGQYQYRMRAFKPGLVKIVGFTASDTSQNKTTIDEETPLEQISVNDATPPVIDMTSFQAYVNYSSSTKDYAVTGDTIYWSVKVTDNDAIKDVVLELNDQNGNSITKKMRSSNLVYGTSLAVSENLVGKLKVTSITAVDNSNNKRMIDTKLSTGDFPLYYNVSKLVSISDMGTYTYTGRGIFPDPVVKKGDCVLIRNVDYELTYTNNINAGNNAKITLTGKGDYLGTKTQLFTISRKETTPKIEMDTLIPYSGKKVKPEHIVVKDGDKVLEFNDDYGDYLINYYNYDIDDELHQVDECREIGKYLVKVTLRGNYKGQAQLLFYITKKDNTMTVKPVTKTVKVKKLKKKAQTVAPLKVTSAEGTVSYKITGGTAKAKKALKINARTGKITVKKKTKKGIYKVKVTVKAAGTTEYKPLSKTVTITVKAK